MIFKIEKISILKKKSMKKSKITKTKKKMKKIQKYIIKKKEK